MPSESASRDAPPPPCWTPPLWPVWLLVALRFVLAGFMPVLSDAALYYDQARVLARDPAILLRLDVSSYPPLFMLLSAGLVPFGDPVLKLLPPLFGGVAVYFTYRLGRELGGEAAGRWAALLLAALPAHLFYSTLGYLDGPVTAWSIAALYAFHRALRSGGRWIPAAGVLMGLGALTKASAVPLFFMVGFYLVARALHLRKVEAPLLSRCLQILVIGGLIAAPYYGKNLLQGGFITPGTAAGLSGITWTSRIPPELLNTHFLGSVLQPNYDPASTALSYLSAAYWEAWGFPVGRPELVQAYLPGPILLLYAAATVLLTAIALLGMARTFHRGYAILWLTLAAWIIPTLTSPVDVFWGFRRMLPLAPVLAILAAPGFARLGDSSARGDSPEARRPLWTRLQVPRLLRILVALALAAAVASQVGKVAIAHHYHQQKQPALEAIASLPGDPLLLVADDDLVRYYAQKRGVPLAYLSPAALNESVLRLLNISYVVRDERYILYDVGPYNRAMETLVSEGVLRLHWQGPLSAIYEVAAGSGPRKSF